MPSLLVGLGTRLPREKNKLGRQALSFDGDGSKIVGYVINHIKAVVSESMLLTNFQSSCSLSTFGVGVEGTFGNTKYFGEMNDFFVLSDYSNSGFWRHRWTRRFRNVAITVVFTLKDNDGGGGRRENKASTMAV